MSDAYALFRKARSASAPAWPPRRPCRSRRRSGSSPDKASIREALGIAYFRLARWEEAEREFRTIVEELSPTDDYAHYALGRALEQQGRDRRGERPLQARELDEARARRRTPRASATSRRRPGEGGRPARRPRVRSTPGGSIGAGLCVLLGVADGDDDARRRSGSRGRSRASGSSRTTTASSTARCSTRAARRSSSAVHADRRHARRGTGRASPAPPGPSAAEPLYERFCAALRELGVAGRDGRLRRADGGRARERRARSRSSSMSLTSDPRRVLEPGSATFPATTFRARSRWARGAHFSSVGGLVQFEVAIGNTAEKERSCSATSHGRSSRRCPASRCSHSSCTGKERFCVYVDHPQGVDHALCERVTGRAAARISTTTRSRSPRRASSGRCARGRTSSAPSARTVRVKTETGRVRGEVLSAGERSVQLQNGAGEPADIPYDEIVRANLIDEG